MTLSATTTKVQYNGDGATTSFSVTFVFWDADDLRVILTDVNGVETVWTRGTQYTVSGGGGSTGSIAVETSPTDYTPASGETLTIKSNLDDVQNTSLPAGGSFPSSSVEERLDKTVRLIQQQAEEIARSIVFSESTTSTQQTLPEPSDQKVLGWNGTTLANLTPNSDTYITTPGSATDNALARFNGTTGQNFQNGQTTEDDNGNLTVAGQIKEPAYIDVASATTTDIGAENGRYVRITGTTTITGLGTVAAGTVRHVRFAAALTLTHNGTSLILPGSANITTAANDTATFVSLGSGNWLCANYKKANGLPLAFVDEDDMASDSAILVPSQQSVKKYVDDNASGITRGTQQASTSGTSVDFTSIPSGVNRITVMFNGVSLDGTDNLLVQIGDSGGLETSSYASASGDTAANSSTSTSGFIVRLATASRDYYGAVNLDRIDGNTWVASGSGYITGLEVAEAHGGRKSLSAELDRLSVVATGSNNFDAGAINIFYE